MKTLEEILAYEQSLSLKDRAMQNFDERFKNAAPELKQLAYKINSLDGLWISNLTTGNSLNPLRIWFHAEPGKSNGLFVLLWSVDRRYWHHGVNWSVEMNVGDNPPIERAIHYVLQCNVKHRNDDGDFVFFTKRALDEALELITSIEHHQNNTSWKRIFGIP